MILDDAMKPKRKPRKRNIGSNGWLKTSIQHDTDTYKQKPYDKLLARWGAAGYGVFWYILERMAEKEGPIPANYTYFANKLQVDYELVQSVMEDFGIFSISFRKREEEDVLNQRYANF